MINSFSVIVPVLNKENEIIRTLESVEESISYFFDHYISHPVEAEVVVVNEGSTDRTPELVANYIQDKPHYKLIHHAKRVSAGAARNTGAKVSKGDILFFCDADDLYFKDHIYLCFQVLNHDPLANPNAAFSLETEQGTKTIQLPNQSVGVVRTGVHMKDSLHPYWKAAIENTLPQNLCIRRDCHEFIEGYPEARIPYNQITCEDISYDLWIAKFFKVVKVEVETVEYIRYPGNMFDKQLKKFQTPPEQYQDDTPPETRELHAIRQKIEQERITYLIDKFRRIEKTPEFLAVLNWQQLGTEYLNNNCHQEAILLFEQGIKLDPTNQTAKNLLAAAYNNLGSALRGQGNVDQAIDYFKQAIALQPTFPKSDLSKVHFNLATSLRDQKHYDQALSYLEKALELEPALPEAIAELPKLQYQSEVFERGYQFSQDWFSINIPVWKQFLTRFINVPDLRVLEIGSWEGRSTCWLLENVLTHPAARITCVDPFEGSVEHKVMVDESIVQTIEQRFDFNVAKTGAPEKVRKVVGASQSVLRSLIPNSFDLAYIDGSHVASDVLEDAILTWRLVKIGGMIIFDDYGFRFPQGIAEDPPKVAIDAFLNIFNKKIKLIHQGYQVLVEKTAE